MTTAYADDAVVALLEPIATPIALTANANLFLGPMRDPEDGVPARCVFVVQSGQVRDSVFVYEQVLVEVRADRSDYAGGLALARACESALHCPVIPSGWTDVQVPSGPLYASTDAVGRHVWRLNVSMCRSQVSS
jgi:hypothetical protein